jgi:hypothetical protein
MNKTNWYTGFEEGNTDHRVVFSTPWGELLRYSEGYSMIRGPWPNEQGALKSKAEDDRKIQQAQQSSAIWIAIRALEWVIGECEKKAEDARDDASWREHIEDKKEALATLRNMVD